MCLRKHGLTRWCVERVVDVVGHPCSKAPVVATVLEYIPHWHSSMGDAMDKHVLQYSLGIVEGVAHAGQAVAEERKHYSVLG